MSKIEAMRDCLEAEFSPSRLSIIDESSKHAGHAGAHPDGETHFRIEITSEKFAGLSRVARHRLINDSLKEFFHKGLHALGIHAISPTES